MVISQGDVYRFTEGLGCERYLLTERVGKLSPAKIGLVLSGIDVILGR
jgi:hypothetical protein